jgi:hypothetical protein
MTNIENKIFSYYSRDSDLYDEFLIKKGRLKMCIKKKLIFMENAPLRTAKLNSKAKSYFFN